jgi:urease accessory protein
VAITAARGTHVEWLPQESIVFDGALADVEWEARLEGDATLIAWDIVRLGRTASGERFEKGRVNSSMRVVRDGRVAWIERARIDPRGVVMQGPAGLASEPVFATMVCASGLVDDECLARCREAVATTGEAAVTRLPGLLVARYRGGSTQAVREYFTSLWSILRPRVSGRDAVEPRIWST